MQMLIIAVLYSLTLVRIIEARSWDDLLQADITCCNTVTDEDECEATYGGSSCVWLEWGINDDVDNIITQSGSQCVGSDYYYCRIETDDCCAPGCDDNSEGSTTSSPARWPTPEPTRACSKGTAYPNCVLGGNYAFEGVPCQISGDPHTKTFNGGYHDFQGQPLTYNDDDELRNQFYYIAPCDGSSTVDLPFTVLGTHYHFGDRIVSGLDYLTLELYDSRRSSTPDYYLYLSSSITAYADADADDVSTDYDDTLEAAESELIEMEDGSVSIGSRFVANITSTGYTTYLVLNIDDSYNVTIYMKGQAALEETDAGDERYRMHYVYIDQASAYKCASCGLCGNFKDDYNQSAAHQSLEICDGSLVEYNTGIDDEALENFDPEGWTYEYNFWNDGCEEYNISDNNGDDFEYEDSCDTSTSFQAQVNAKCAIARAQQTRCCAILTDAVCDELQDDCEVDVCIMSTVNGVGNSSLIDGYVNSTLTASIEGACDIPGVEDAFDVASLTEYEHVGCWKDDEDARAINYTKQNYDDLDECITHCYDNDFSFAAAENSSHTFRCFCTNDQDAYQQYGVSTLCKNGVGGYLIIAKRNNRTTLEAMDVYKITSISDEATTTSSPETTTTSTTTASPTTEPTTSETTTSTPAPVPTSRPTVTSRPTMTSRPTWTSRPTIVRTTNTARPTLTSRPTYTRTTNTARPTMTSRPTQTSRPTNTARPTRAVIAADLLIDDEEHVRGQDWDDEDVLAVDLEHDDDGHIRGEDWNGDDAALLAANYVDEVHVRGQDRNGEDELSVNLLHDDEEHIRGQDWNGDIAVDSLLALEGRDVHARNEHKRGQDWDGDIEVERLVALEDDAHNDHVRGQDRDEQEVGEMVENEGHVRGQDHDDSKNEEEGHHIRDHEEEAHDRESESGNVRDRNGGKHEEDVLAEDLKHNDDEHVRGQDREDSLSEELADGHVRGQDPNVDDEHVRGQDWDDVDVLTADLEHDDDGHIRGEDWNGDDAALLAANYVDEVHVRGQDRNGEDVNEEFVVIHDDSGYSLSVSHRVAMSNYFLAILPAVAIVAAFICFGAYRMSRCKERKECAPLLDGSGKSSVVVYGV